MTNVSGFSNSFFIENSTETLVVRNLAVRRPVARVSFSTRDDRRNCEYLRAAFILFDRAQAIREALQERLPMQVYLRPDCRACGIRTAGWCEICRAGLCQECDTEDQGVCPICTQCQPAAIVRVAKEEWRSYQDLPSSISSRWINTGIVPNEWRLRDE